MRSRIELILGVLTITLLTLGASWSMVESHAAVERDKLDLLRDLITTEHAAIRRDIDILRNSLPR